MTNDTSTCVADAETNNDVNTSNNINDTTRTSNNNNNNNNMNPTESDVYDRQIRLWGIEAQKKMQNSKVLYINVTGTTSEVIKNLVLAGISATICDTRPASVLQTEPCFFTPIYNNSESTTTTNNDDSTSKKRIKYISVADVVQPLIEELNPLLSNTCQIINKSFSEFTFEDIQEYTVVVASQIPLVDAIRISELLKSTTKGAYFYLVDCFGMYGAAMIDLGKNYKYRPEQGKKLLDPITVKDYIPFKQMIRNVSLHEATNRFHKQPPPIWIMYRSLLEYQQQTNSWLGSVSDDSGNNNDIERRIIIETFLKKEKVTLSDDQLDTLINAGMAQIVPVCAVLGGIIGNEIIKVISHKGEPANNTLLFDGNTCKAWNFFIQPKKDMKWHKS